jgi:hypothetical protein
VEPRLRAFFALGAEPWWPRRKDHANGLPCWGVVSGFGWRSYTLAIDALRDRLASVS